MGLSQKTKHQKNKQTIEKFKAAKENAKEKTTTPMNRRRELKI